MKRRDFLLQSAALLVAPLASGAPRAPFAPAARSAPRTSRLILLGTAGGPTPKTIALAKGADVLVHEALYLPAAPGAPGSALRKHVLESHTPVEEVGRVAAEAGVRTLVLSHLVPSEDPPITDDQWLAGARTHFSGHIVVGHDLLEI